MFKELLDKSEKTIHTGLNKIVKDIQKDFVALWTSEVQNLATEKARLEETNTKAKVEHDRMLKEVTDLSGKLVKLHKSVETEKENLKKYEAQEQKLLDSIIQIEEREQDSLKVKNSLDKKEKELENKEMEQKIKTNVLVNKEKTIRRLYDQAQA